MTITLLAIATFLAFQLVQLAYIVSQATVGQWVGATVEAMSIGTGPILWHRTIRGVDWRISLIPYGGYTTFFGQDDDEVQDVSRSFMESDTDDRVRLADLSIGGRFLLLLTGPLSNIVIGICLLWVPVAVDANQVVVRHQAEIPIEPRAVPQLGISNQPTTWSGQIQLFRDTFVEFWRLIAPKKGWGGYVGWLVTCGAAGSISGFAWITCFGVVCTGIGVLNLLPIPVLNGGHIMFLIVEAIFGRLAEKTVIHLTIPAILFILCIWLYLVFIDIRWCLTALRIGDMAQ